MHIQNNVELPNKCHKPDNAEEINRNLHILTIEFMMESHMVHVDIFQTPSFLKKYNRLINLKMKSRAKVFCNLRA